MKHQWVARMARVGYAAKGTVYLALGWLAGQAALRAGVRPKGQDGALEAMVDEPAGQLLVGLVALGLVAYMAWRLVQAVLDPDHQGAHPGAILHRLGYALSAVVYGGLVFTALQILRGVRHDSHEERADDWTAWLMQQPYGEEIVLAVGVGVVLGGLYHLYEAWAAKFTDKLRLSSMSPGERTWVVRLGRCGMAARGVVFLLIGGFLVKAAHGSRPQDAQALEGALKTLDREPAVLGVVALGLIAYGLYMWVAVWYRRRVGAAE